ncbi:hypothetical protein G5V59_09905 [Nocardioides sp. W3-2-3]|nr:hypothetical protein [Nocardioides convexus]
MAVRRTARSRLLVDGNPVGSPVALVNGAASFAPLTSLTAGTHTLAASYAGSGRYLPGTDQVQQQVGPAGTTVALVASPSPSLQDQEVRLTASVAALSPGSGSPTGTVDFAANGESIGSAPLSGGSAVLEVSDLAPGSYQLTATYAGDDDYTGSAASPISHTVIEGTAVVATTTTLSSSADPSTYGDLITFRAEVAAGDSSPHGTVQFSVDGQDLGDPVEVEDGVAESATLASPDPGDHTVIAAFTPEPGFAGSGDILVQTVRAAGVDVDLTSTKADAQVGDTVRFRVDVRSQVAGTGSPTGYVQARGRRPAAGRRPRVGGRHRHRPGGLRPRTRHAHGDGALLRRRALHPGARRGSPSGSRRSPPRPPSRWPPAAPPTATPWPSPRRSPRRTTASACPAARSPSGPAPPTSAPCRCPRPAPRRLSTAALPAGTHQAAGGLQRGAGLRRQHLRRQEPDDRQAGDGDQGGRGGGLAESAGPAAGPAPRDGHRRWRAAGRRTGGVPGGRQARVHLGDQRHRRGDLQRRRTACWPCCSTAATRPPSSGTPTTSRPRRPAPSSSEPGSDERNCRAPNDRCSRGLHPDAGDPRRPGLVGLRRHHRAVLRRRPARQASRCRRAAPRTAPAASTRADRRRRCRLLSGGSVVFESVQGGTGAKSVTVDSHSLRQRGLHGPRDRAEALGLPLLHQQHDHHRPRGHHRQPHPGWPTPARPRVRRTPPSRSGPR